MSKIETKIPESIFPNWNKQGLIPAITQDAETGEVLMLAWMNTESLKRTLAEEQVVYWSRSRKCLWRKGETSGNTQELVTAKLDCDGDTLLLKVRQKGAGACHTGRRSCFFYSPVGHHWRLDKDT